MVFKVEKSKQNIIYWTIILFLSVYLLLASEPQQIVAIRTHLVVLSFYHVSHEVQTQVLRLGGSSTLAILKTPDNPFKIQWPKEIMKTQVNF